MSADRGAQPPAGDVALPLVLGALASLAALSVSAVAVTLPALGADLGVASATTAWVIAAYGLTLGLGTAVFGRLSDSWGLRRTLLVGVALFVAGAMLAAFAPSLPLLVAGRLFQGAGGGAVTVVALGVLAVRFEGAARTAAVARLVAVITVVSGCGTLIGGALAQATDWRVVMALPVLALGLVLWVAPRTPQARRTQDRFDGAGAALVAVTTAGALVLLQAPSLALPVTFVVLLAVALVIGIGLLVRHVRDHPAGFLPRQIVTDARFALGALAALCLQAAYFAMIFAAPLLLGESLGTDPLAIGAALLPAAAIGAAADLAAGRAASRVGSYLVAAARAIARAAGLLVGAVLDSPVSVVLAFALAISGFAGGQSVLNDATMTLVRPADLGVAVGVFNLVLNLGGALGSAAAGGLTSALSLSAALALLALVPVAGAIAALAARQRNVADAPAPDQVIVA